MTIAQDIRISSLSKYVSRCATTVMKAGKNVYIYLMGHLNLRIGAILIVAVNVCFFKISFQRKLLLVYPTDSNDAVSSFIGVVIAETDEK